jgi:hypothetical protein
VFLAATFLAAFLFADPTSDALLKGVEQTRQKFDSIHAAFTIDCDNDEIYGTMQIKIVVEQNESYRKVEICPQRGDSELPHELSLVSPSEVFSYRRTQNADLELYDINLAKKRAILSFDPRILGLTDVLTIDKTVKICLGIARSGWQLVGREILNGVQTWHIRRMDEFGTTEFWIEEPSFRVYRKSYLSEHLKTTIDSKYDSNSVGPFPSEVNIKRFRNNKSVFNRKVTVTQIEQKNDIPKHHFELTSLNLPLNTMGNDYRIQKIIGYWDGEKLVDNPVRMSAQELRELMEAKPSFGIARMLLAGVGLLIASISITIIFMIRKKMKKV